MSQGGQYKILLGQRIRDPVADDWTDLEESSDNKSPFTASVNAVRGRSMKSSFGEDDRQGGRIFICFCFNCYR